MLQKVKQKVYVHEQRDYDGSYVQKITSSFTPGPEWVKGEYIHNFPYWCNYHPEGIESDVYYVVTEYEVEDD